jgi:DNA polymerase-3 subunit alpha
MYVINEKGWDSLLSINKQINVHNKGFVHNIDVLDHSEGLVCVIDFSSNVFQDITDLKHYKSILNSYIENFGENLYFQLSSAIFSDDRVYLKCLNSLKFFLDNFHDTGVKIILLDDVYYLEESHAHCKDILNKIGGFTRHYSPNQFMKTSEETLQVIGEYFDDYDKFQNLINEGLESANKLVEICNYNIPIGEPKLPMFEIDGVELTKSESDNLLWDLCQIGMENIIYKKIPKSKHHIYEKRLKHEFDIISGAGFSDYFLILADVVDFANSNKVFVGPGRGSAAGSLLAYVIGVTLVDPIEYGLLFERFLNESRFKESFNYTVTLENNTVLSFTEGELVKMEDGSKIESNKLVEGDEVSSTYSV